MDHNVLALLGNEGSMCIFSPSSANDCLSLEGENASVDAPADMEAMNATNEEAGGNRPQRRSIDGDRGQETVASVLKSITMREGSGAGGLNPTTGSGLQVGSGAGGLNPTMGSGLQGGSGAGGLNPTTGSGPQGGSGAGGLNSTAGDNPVKNDSSMNDDGSYYFDGYIRTDTDVQTTPHSVFFPEEIR